MIKWEYMYVESFNHRVIKINNKMVQDTAYIDIASKVGGNNLELIVNEFLGAVGHRGWEVSGICDASEDGKSWRMILKRPISE